DRPEAPGQPDGGRRPRRRRPPRARPGGFRWGPVRAGRACGRGPNPLEGPPGPPGRRARAGRPRRRRSGRGPRGCRRRAALLPARGPCGRRLRWGLLGVGTLGRRALRTEVEANGALLEPEPGLEGPARPRPEALQRRALAPPEERPRGAGAARLSRPRPPHP